MFPCTPPLQVPAELISQGTQCTCLGEHKMCTVPEGSFSVRISEDALHLTHLSATHVGVCCDERASSSPPGKILSRSCRELRLGTYCRPSGPCWVSQLQTFPLPLRRSAILILSRSRSAQEEPAMYAACTPGVTHLELTSAAGHRESGF